MKGQFRGVGGRLGVAFCHNEKKCLFWSGDDVIKEETSSCFTSVFYAINKFVV